jgi:tRNA-dihydrouridine synthase A
MVVNGGFRTVAQVEEALGTFDGVMIGREAYHRPQLLAELQARLYPDAPAPLSRVVEAMREYAERETRLGTPLPAITRHMLGLLAGRPGARELRQVLSAQVRHSPDIKEIFGRTLTLVSQAA